ncbi:hypothetical protein J6590_058516 [Homalodisca vitripennis]|nr:hypothetical protein J6590_058516 [Homalodisca vitripennis]
MDSCRAAFRHLGILTIIGLYILETILFATKTGHARTGDIHPYNTRHRNNFLLDPHHLTLFEKKPSYKGAMFFNNLPDYLRKLPEKNFKASLRSWLLEHPYYSVQEYLQWRTSAFKAFDCLGQNLISKNTCSFLGVRGLENKWFDSYLKERTHVMEIQHMSSSLTSMFRLYPKPIARGVPMGSVLGPNLFILLTNISQL